MTTTETRDKRRSTAWQCLFVFVLALGLRWTHLQAVQETVYPGELAFLEDARYYASWSEEIAAGDLVGKHSFFMGPLYPYSLALVRPLAEGAPIEQVKGRTVYHYSHIYQLQAVFGALCCVLIWGITRFLLGAWQAWLAALLAASQRIFIYYEGLLMPSSQALFLILGTLALLLFAMQRQRAVLWWVCGVALGLAVLAKAPSLLLLPPVLLWLLYGDRSAPRRLRWKNVGVLLLGCLPVIGLATAHNYAADGDLVLVTSNAGANLWIGNGPQASGAHAGVTTRFESAKLDFHRFGAERKLGEPPASEVSRELSRDARQYMAANPRAALGLFWKKFRMFWSAIEIGTNDQYEFFKRFSGVLRVPFPGFGWIAPLGLLGLLVTLGRWRTFWPLHLLVATQALSFTVFFALGRYRLASVACLIVFAVAALDWALAMIRERRRAPLAWGGVCLVLGLLLVHWPIQGMGAERGFANQQFLLASHADAQGIDSMPLYLKALDAEWREGDMSLRQQAASHLRVGDAHLGSGLRKRAVAEYERALEACDQMSREFRYRRPMLKIVEQRMQAVGRGKPQ